MDKANGLLRLFAVAAGTRSRFAEVPLSLHIGREQAATLTRHGRRVPSSGSAARLSKRDQIVISTVSSL
jgi:hypothetical protein